MSTKYASFAAGGLGGALGPPRGEGVQPLKNVGNLVKAWKEQFMPGGKFGLTNIGLYVVVVVGGGGVDLLLIILSSVYRLCMP